MSTIISRPDGSYSVTVEIPNTKALAQFLATLPQAQTETYITNAQAVQIAQERGITLPASTLISACNRGNIPGAQKQGGRWKIPQHAFVRWLTRENPDADEHAIWGQRGH